MNSPLKIILTHGYFIHEDIKEKSIMRPYPPLGILYLSAWLEKHGIDHEVFDTTFSSKEVFYNFLDQEKPDIIPIYTNLMTKINVVGMIKYIKENPALLHATIVLGGPDVTYNIENYLAAGSDILVIGEGEQTLLEIVQTIQKGNRTEFGHISGLAYKDQNGNIIKTEARKRIRPVDDIPFPNRHKIDYHQYLDTWKKHHGQSTVSVSTQRGCPYTCNWCSTAVYGQSYRRRSPEIIVDELIEIKKQYNPDSLWFVDDVFTVSHEWLRKFAHEVVRRKAIIPFECITRADRMSVEVIDLLKQAGAFRVWIGAESGSQKIIDAMDRRVDVNTVRAMIRLTKKAGIETGTFIMLGYPGETEEDIISTIHHLKDSDPDHFTITLAYPIKGTGLYEAVEHLHNSSLDWNTSTDRDIDFSRTYSKTYYRYAISRVVNEVHHYKMSIKNKRLSPAALKLKLKYKMASVGMWWEKNKSLS
jgi:radical SAM superfamily enzyme YgiQ (UPF0313 family)